MNWTRWLLLLALALGFGLFLAFGPREEILKKIGLAPATPANLKVVQAAPAGGER